MGVLHTIVQIWKSGAEIYRDQKDGRLGIKNHQLIPPQVLQDAEKIFSEIDDYFRSWEQEPPAKKTMQEIYKNMCGWQRNEKLYEWLLNDHESINLFYKWTILLAQNNWTDTYEDYRKYETTESDELATIIYKRAIKHRRAKAQ